MENNFIIIKRCPTPEELLKSLISIVPEFELYWSRTENYFRNDDGSFSLHGVFSELTSFVKENFAKLEGNQLHNLFEFVEKCVLIDPYSDTGVSNAANTCFIENLAGEGELSAAITPYLGVESKSHFEKWN